MLRKLSIFLILAIAGCGGKSVDINNPPTEFEQKTQSVSTSGATLSLSNGKAVLEIPAGALASSSEVEIASESKLASIPKDVPTLTDYSLRVTVDASKFSGDTLGTLTIPVAPLDLSEGRHVWCAYLTDDGKPLAEEAQYDASTSQATLTIKKSMLQSTPVRGGDNKSGHFSLFVDGKRTDQEYADARLYRFSPSPLSTPPNDLGDGYPPDPSRLSGWWVRVTGFKQGELQGKRVAIVVHGINNNMTKLSQLADALLKVDRYQDPQHRKQYDAVYGITYNWKAPIQESGVLAAAQITKIGDAGAVIDLYGHSMGGLVLRSAIEFVMPDPSKLGVARFLSFGTPHMGVPVNITATMRLFVNTATFDNMGVRDLSRSSSIIDRLRNSSPAKNVQYAAIAGTSSDYHGSLGSAIQNRIYGSEPCDGVVGKTSALAENWPLGSRVIEIYRLKTYNLAHDKICGAYEGSTFNLDPVFKAYASGRNIFDLPTEE